MLRRIAPLAFVLLAAACGPSDEPAESPAAAAPEPAPAAAPVRVPAPVPVGPSAFVGRWAAQPTLCEAGAWVFAADRLETAGEVACNFSKVERTAAGWKINARCTAQAPEQDAELTLTLTDPAPPETMTVAGGPFQTVTLRRCP